MRFFGSTSSKDEILRFWTPKFPKFSRLTPQIADFQLIITKDDRKITIHKRNLVWCHTTETFLANLWFFELVKIASRVGCTSLKNEIFWLTSSKMRFGQNEFETRVLVTSLKKTLQYSKMVCASSGESLDCCQDLQKLDCCGQIEKWNRNQSSDLQRF